jgi:hypothetical protein
MTTSLWLMIAVTGLLGLLGVVLHEATHWVLWRVQGRRAVFTLQGIQPVVIVPDASMQDVERRDRIAALAPLAIGLASAGLALAVGLPVTMPMLGAWLGYTGVSVLDLQLAFYSSTASASGPSP